VAAIRGASKAAIHAAASDLFAENGYANTPVRDIAARAGVDPALVMRHFGTKELLFIETMRLDADAMLWFDPPLETLGERIVRFVLGTDPRIRSVYVALVRASDSGGVGSMLRTFHEEGFVAQLRDLLEGDDRDLRARLLAAQVGGLMYALWTVEDDGLAAADPDAIVALYAPGLQRLITPGA
jgi:AcrR family transcriptional regulator